MHGINKTFGAVRALHQVDLHVAAGEVLGLVGDNAAGKSTLMKILAGAIRPDTGEIRIAGNPVDHLDPISARSAGIEMIYQDFALVPQLTVTQNIFLGREIQRRFFGLRLLNKREMNERARALFASLGLRVPSVTNPVLALSGGQQHARTGPSTGHRWNW
jgi:simple sugar transport system ATP-binding protein